MSLAFICKIKSGGALTLAGLDEHRVRRWDSWHRWVTLALLAHASSPSPQPSNAATRPRPTTEPAPAD